MSWRWFARVGAVCLVVGSVAELLEYIVSPIASSGDDAAKQVAMASMHPTAMGWTLALDALLLLLVPGVLFIGWLAGAGEHRLPAVGTAIAFMAFLAAVFLIANDVVVYEAARLDTPDAVKMVHGYQTNALVTVMLAVFLVGFAVGFVLLAISLWRRRAVRGWAAVALGIIPFLEFAGVETGVTLIATAAYALAVVVYTICAIALLQGRANGASLASRFTPESPDVAVG